MSTFVARAFGACLLVAGVIAPDAQADASQASEAAPWTLGSVTRRVIEVSPEPRALDAEVAARAADLARDSAFPNPTAEVRFDQRLGLERGSGGTDVTQIAVSQPLPLWRLTHQRAQAEARLDAARAARSYRQLLLENHAARAFHRLQLAEQRKRLAAARAATTGRYLARKGDGGDLVRYLSAPDRTRLSILGQEAQLEEMAADGDWREALAEFHVLLALPSGAALAVAAPATPLPPAPLAEYEARLDQHPALLASQRELEAARAGILAARATRFADPVLTLFNERDVFGGRPQDSWGAAIGIELPLWSRGRGAVDAAVADAERSAADGQARRRDLESALRAGHLRLTRLVEQSRRHADLVVEPSRRFLDLTRRGFAAGEQGVLALVDASNNYFDAEQQYAALAADAALAAADFRLAAGESVLAEVAP